MSEWASRISRRFWGGVGDRILESGALDDVLKQPGLPADSVARLSDYMRRWAYWENDRLYRRLYRAGQCAQEVPTEWNPVPASVQFYITNTLRDADEVQPLDEAADAAALAEAVGQIWEWSNFQTMRRQVTRTAAVLSDVFLKVAEKRPSDDAPVVAVYMQEIDPRRVVWWEADERGFLTAVRIDTPRLDSIFTGETRRHTLVEVWRKDWAGPGTGGVAFFEVGPTAPLDDDRLGEAVAFRSFDDLGYDFIPLVWARVPTPWVAMTDSIDLYNVRSWVAARLNRPLYVVRSNTLDSRGAPLPAPRMDAEALEAGYTDVGDGAVGVLYMPGMADIQPAGSPADLAALGMQLAAVRQGIIDALPEYRIATLDASTQLATETLELLLSHASQRVLDTRAELERALVRAHMMAITIAQTAELLPELFAPERVGTYDDGRINHEFVERPVFAKSATARAAEVQALVGAGASIEGAAAVAGYSDAEVEALIRGDVVDGVTQ